MKPYNPPATVLPYTDALLLQEASRVDPMREKSVVRIEAIDLATESAMRRNPGLFRAEALAEMQERAKLRETLKIKGV